MTDDEQEAPRRVVRRVVRRPSEQPAKPSVRYGRTVAPPVDPDTRTSDVADDPLVDAPPDVVREPRVDLRAALGQARHGVGGAATGAGRALRRGGGVLGRGASRGARRIAALRLPRLEPLPAAAVTGLVVGLAAVALGAASLWGFSQVRGVGGGGGVWGTLVFAVLSVLAVVGGRFLLQGFGVRSPQVTSFLGVMVTIIVMLGLFLEQFDSALAWLVVPAVGAAATAAAQWAVAAAEDA